MTVKMSISLSDDDAAYLDREAGAGRFANRSATVQHALRLLRESELADAYAQAYSDWSDSADGSAWGASSGDGLDAE